jgi:hypothetical protein
LKRFILLSVFVLLFVFNGFSQNSVSPYLFGGYINHLTRNGINGGVGVDFEIVKYVNLAAEYRYSLLDNNTGNQVDISGYSMFLSYVILNKKHHKVMAGTGVSYEKYTRYTESIGFEKQYYGYCFNPVKLRYDYIFDSNFKIGVDATMYGDDGDDSMFFGVVLGYVF